MTTANFEHRSPPLAMILLVTTVLFSIALVATQLTTHALEKHGEFAVAVNQCLNGDDTVEFYHPDTGRDAFAACMVNGRFGIQIDEPTGENVTAYPTRYKTAEQVIRWMKDHGWVLRR